jgi:hypothetical protein
MKKVLLIAILAIGLIFIACQNSKTPSPETPTIKENNNTKTMESSAFVVTVPANLILEATEDRGRIQNFTPDSDLYTLKDGEYFIEIIFNITDETYSENIFRGEYKTVEKSSLNGTSALYGIDRLPAGDSGPGIGYYIPDTLAINIYSESDNGLTSAKELLKSLILK